MKTAVHLKSNITNLVLFMLLITLVPPPLISQYSVGLSGHTSDNEGFVAWNANGMGPEPAATGHLNPGSIGTQYYYAASPDYDNMNPASNAALCHFTSVSAIQFPNFSAAMVAYGYQLTQVQIRAGLTTLGDDILGKDWYDFYLLPGLNRVFMNYYDQVFTFLLNGEPMLVATVNYSNWLYPGFTANVWSAVTNYFKPVNASGSSSAGVQAAADAFLTDLGDMELRMTISEATWANVNINSNGRSGGFFNFLGSLEIGAPHFSLTGYANDHKGFVTWNADGTGDEIKGYGEKLPGGSIESYYYLASRDYDGIDTNTEACLGHLIDWTLQNLKLQLLHQGLDSSMIQAKLGMASLDNPSGLLPKPGLSYSYHHAPISFYLDDYALFTLVFDTLKVENTVWLNSFESSTGIPHFYDYPNNANLQAIIDALMLEIDKRHLAVYVEYEATNDTLSQDGRTGVFWKLTDCPFTAVQPKGTIISPGVVSGNWTRAGSPYVITGHIKVPDGQTLTIEPGTWIKFDGKYYMEIDGRVLAVGDSSKQGKIYFTPTCPEKGWAGIKLFNVSVSNDSSIFDYCIFEYGQAFDSLVQSGGAIAAYMTNKFRVDHSIFRYNQANVIKATPTVGGAIALWGSSPVIQNSIFHDNYAVEEGGAIFCYEFSHPIIHRNRFYRNHSGYYGGAIAIYPNCAPEIVNNTFCQNVVDDTLNGSGGAIDIYTIKKMMLINNIFWGNTAVVGPEITTWEQPDSLCILYSLLEGGVAAIHGTPSGTCFGIIDADPLFTDYLACDFRFGWESPCHNTGDPSILDPDGTVSDIGWYFAPVWAGLPEFYPLTSLHLYPNPSKGWINLQYHNHQVGTGLYLEIFNLLGETVLSKELSMNSAGAQDLMLDVSFLVPGTYILKLGSVQHVLTSKFIKL